MAVYKSTFNYPFMNNIEIRTALTNASSTYPFQFLTCKVDTSNKNITGYSIRVLDEDNNSVFESEYISPIEELQTGEMAQYYEPNGVNSGVNGTFLKIPFFQNYNKKMVDSYNAIYYKPKYMVDYLITNLELPEDYPNNSRDFCNPENWILLDTGNYRFNWESVNSTLTSAEIQKLKEQNNIYLDGELILEGQIILVANNGLSGVVSGFYRVLKKNGEYTQTELEPVSWADWLTYSSIPYQTTVARGNTLSNKVVNKDEFNNFTYETNLFLWVKRDDTTISNFCSGSTSYKWEVTLYQGEGVVSLIPDETLCINYDDLDVKYYDMTISSGTILGSNSERIQIADIVPWEYSPTWGLQKRNPILPSSANGTLVLQGKYMSFGTGTWYSDYSFPSTERFYVQSYDSVYGHVYPVENSGIGEMVNSYDKIRFYKYSTNPNDILTTDIVEYGLDKQISFVLCKVVKTDEERYRGEVVSSFDDVGINNRLYGIDRSVLEESCPTINSLISQDQKILITNNTKPYMNGVYTAYERDDIDFYNSDGVKIDLDLVFLKRSASFNTWGSFIGKVIYVSTFCEEDGSLTTENIESLAGSGPDYNLWNPDNVESGDSNLFFSKELPILLFDSKITHYVDLFEYSSIETIASKMMADGVVIKSGMVVMCKNMIGRYTTVSGGALYQFNSDGYTKIGTTNTVFPFYVYVKQGQKFGKKVINYIEGPSDIGVTWELHTAEVLKNNSFLTFITPSNEIKAGMKIKFRGNNYIKVQNKEEKTQWLSVVDYNSTVNCVLHGFKQTSPSEPVSYIDYLNEPAFLVSEKSDANKTPWKYEIRSFFKASDFNPFYCYENPYLILYKNGREYSTLSNIVGEQGIVANAVSEDDSSLVINYYADSNVSFSNVLKLSAKYVQNQGVSWESYRWVLLNSDGNMLQDTGKKYDKEMSVVFYGLSSDSAVDYSVYYATLYVEDELKNLCVYTVKLVVKPGESKNSGIPFTAEYQCDADAVKISYGGNNQLIPSYRDMNDRTDSLYIDSNPNFDKGVSYTNGNGFSITNKNGSTDRPVDYFKGSEIDGTDGTSATYFSEISQGNKIGIPYYTSFSTIDAVQEINKNKCFELPGQSGLDEDQGQLYFETEFSLNDNQCGHILDYMVEGVLEENDILLEPCYHDDGSTNDLRGYLTFELLTNDVFNSYPPTIDDLNPDRNKFKFKFTAYSLLNDQLYSTIEDNIENIETFTIYSSAENSNIRYYIQTDGSGPFENKEYYDFEFSNKMFIKKDKNNNFFTSGSDSDLGNLCLTSGLSTASNDFVYWAEDRKYLQPSGFLPESKKYYDNPTLGQYIIDSYDSQNWPQQNTEASFYWRETDSLLTAAPLLWEDVLATTNGVRQVKGVDRNLNKGSKDYHLISKIYNVQDFYFSLLHNEVTYEQDMIEQNKIKIVFKVQNSVVGEILIEQFSA